MIQRFILARKLLEERRKLKAADVTILRLKFVASKKEEEMDIVNLPPFPNNKSLPSSTPNENVAPTAKGALQCKYCNKGFKFQQGKSRHELYSCKSKPLETQVQVINNNTNNSHNTNTNNTNTNNTLNHNQTTNNNQITNNQITLNVYGEETIPKNDEIDIDDDDDDNTDAMLVDDSKPESNDEVHSLL